jgi:G3E family GTPase
MKVKIVCGFLGSGKTTFLQNILKNSSKKTVVLINELGDVAIDGDVVSKRGNLEVIELPSGCICCVLRADLITTVEQIFKEIKPQRLIVEPSGIAAPSGILETLQESRVYDSLEIEAVVGIIDATTFLEDYESGGYGNFFLDQISNSDILLINKCDMVADDGTEKIEGIVKDLNKSALVFKTVYCSTPVHEGKSSDEITTFDSSIHLDSFSIQTNGTFDEEKVIKFFGALSSGNFGDIRRAKGIFKTEESYINLDYVPKNVDFKKLEKGKASKFVAIGRSLDKSLIEEQLLRAKSDTQ